VCAKCGAANVKLWRQYSTFLNHIELHCARCAGAAQKKDVSDIDKDGKRTCDVMGHPARTDSIGWLVPAVPTEEEDTYWGYTSVPEEGVQWWKKLPTLP